MDARDDDAPAKARAARLDALVRYLIAATVLISGVTLAEWSFARLSEPNLERLSNMSPTTAIGLLLASVTLWILRPIDCGRIRRMLGRGIAMLLLAWAAVSLGEHLLLHRVTLALSPPPPSQSLLAFLFLTSALVLLDMDHGIEWRSTRTLGLVGLFIAFLPIVSFVFGANLVYEVAEPPLTRMSLPSGVAFISFSTALLLVRPQRGVMALLASDTSGGVVARHLLIAVVVGAPGLAGLVRLGAILGLYHSSMQPALLIDAIIFLFLALSVMTARTVERKEQLRRKSEEALATESGYIRLLESIASVANESSKLETVIEVSLHRVCRHIGWPIGHAFVLDRATGRQRSSGAWFAADQDRFHQLEEASLEVTLGPGEGLIGAAVSAREPIWVADLASFAGFTRATEATAAGIKSAAAVPIMTRDAVVGVLEIYHYEARAEDPHLVEVLRGISAHLSRAFERIGSEEAVRESELRLRFVLEHLPVGVWLTDQNGTIRMGNEVGQRIWAGARFVAPESFGEYKGWWVETGKRIEADEWAASRAIREGRTTINELIEIEAFDGTRKIILNSAFPIRMRDAAAGAVIVNEEITERYRSEQRERILAQLGEVLVDTRERKRMHERIGEVLVPAVADWCAIAVVEGRRSIHVTHVDPDLAGALRETVEAELEGEASGLRAREAMRLGESYLASSVDGDETLAPASALSIPLKAPGRTFGVLILGSSLERSARRFHQGDLALAEEVASRIALALENARLYQMTKDAVRAREDVLAIVSHDLRAPLSAISLIAQLLAGRAAADEGVRSKAIRMVEATRRMDSMLRDLLDLSRLEAGVFSVRPVLTEMSRVTEELEATFGPLASEKGIRFVVDMPQPPPSGQWDRERIIQALGNLVGNAIKFTEAGGEVRLAFEQRAGQIQICVSDTGPGIPEEEQQHLFDRYWRNHRARGAGAGLGLFICKGIVDAHGGRVWVESQLGRGTRFYIQLPLAPEESQVHRAV